MDNLKIALLGGAMAFALSACGENTGEQAIIGGAAGAIATEVVGGSATTGALVGAAGNILYCKQNPGKCN